MTLVVNGRTGNVMPKSNNKGVQKINHDLVNSVKQKIKSNAGQLTHDELAEAIASDKYLLFNFLLDNNSENIADTLKNKNREKLDFNPSRQQLEAVISGYIQKNDLVSLNKIIGNFKYNRNAGNYTNLPEIHHLLLQKLPR